MAQSQVPYVGQALPAREVWASGTNLYRVAADNLGDATKAYQIAELNGLSDYWIGPLVRLRLPAASKQSNGGVPSNG